MLIYHGTLDKYLNSFETEGILLRKSKTHLDFGRGFYTTENKRAAITTAILRANANNQYPENSFALPAVVILDYSYTPCNKRTFSSPNFEWAGFVLKQRTSPAQHEHDIVCGPVADGSAFLLTQDYINGVITAQEFCEGIHPRGSMSECTQISFHTTNSLSCVQIIGYAILNEKE